MDSSIIPEFAHWPRMKLPPELTECRQWILWRYEQRADSTKPTKVPHTCTGHKASTTKPDHWSGFPYALSMSRRAGFADGIGFVFTADDPFCGIDLDNCYPSDAAECAPWATEILERFSDTYSEESPSETGVKIWCRAKAPRCGKWPLRSGAIEIYDHARYFAVTGKSNGVQVVTDHQADVESLVAYLDEGNQIRSSASVVPLRIPQGKRHNTLVSLAGTMFRRGMSPEAIEAALAETNQRQCDPPYDREHIQKMVESIAGWDR
jgi:primase-polymerase (primpol)-like protein